MLSPLSQNGAPPPQERGFGEHLGGEGLLRVRSNEQLDAAQQAKEAEEAFTGGVPSISSLAGYVRGCFVAAERAKAEYITPRLLRCQRQRKGEYEGDILRKIRDFGGSELYHNITETKCAAAEAWISDVVLPSNSYPFMMYPTPVPNLSEETVQEILERTVGEYNAALNRGMPLTPEETMVLAQELYDERKKAEDEEAAEKIHRMQKKIEDQLEEAEWGSVISEFIQDLCTYPSAILKGPVVRMRRDMQWRNGQVELVEELAPTWEVVSPHDFFPGPNARKVDDSFVCERIQFDRADLSLMRGVEGWNASYIDEVIGSGYGATGSELISGDAERQHMENRNWGGFSSEKDQTIEAIEYWGNVQGRMLTEWGMGEALEDDDFYQVNVVLIGSVVVKAILNPDPLGRRPYYVTSFEKVRGTLWGRGIPEKMAHVQQVQNAMWRNLLNNMSIASGPQVVVDTDVVAPGSDISKIFPWKIWTVATKMYRSGDPITFFQPTSNAGELLTVIERNERTADDVTMIPRYAHGDERVGGAGQTASGLSMLLNSAAKGIKRVIGYVDRDVVRQMVKRLYAWNLQYLEDEELKGDAQVEATGALAELTREADTMRKQEFLAQTNNPLDMQIIGLQGRAHLLREVAKQLKLDPDTVVPSDEVIEQRMMAAMQAPPEDEGEEEVGA